MKILSKTSVVITALLLTLVAGCGSSSSPKTSGSSSASKDTVVTKLLSFKPEKLSVKVGTKVTWKAGDGIGHTVTTGTFTLGSDGLRTAENPDGLIDKPLRAGTDVTYTFTKPGKYVYYCSIHQGMAGEIDVTP